MLMNLVVDRSIARLDYKVGESANSIQAGLCQQ